jgi:hypothetical protein
MIKKILFAVILLANLSLYAETSQGEILEKQVWQYIKDQKWDDLSKKMAPYFQSGYFDGTQNKEQYLKHLMTLKPSDYHMYNFHVTEGPALMVVAYNMGISETIEGKRISSDSVRLSVWQNNNGNWQWIAHAFLVPVPVSK